MSIPLKLLRIYLSEQDKLGAQPLYLRLLEMAAAAGLAGATAYRGVASFGGSHHVHTVKILRLAEELPIVVEIVDTPEKIEGFLELLQAALERAQAGMVTLENLEGVRFPGGSH